MYFVVAAAVSRTGQRTQRGEMAGGRTHGFRNGGGCLEGECKGDRRNLNDLHNGAFRAGARTGRNRPRKQDSKLAHVHLGILAEYHTKSPSRAPRSLKSPGLKRLGLQGCIRGLKAAASSARSKPGPLSASMRFQACASVGQDLDGVGCGWVANCRNGGNWRVEGGPGGEYGLSHCGNGKQVTHLGIEDSSPIPGNIPP